MATLTKQAQEWLKALLCAASSGDAEASGIYAIAKRIAEGDDVNALECAAFESYCLWVTKTGGDDEGVKQYAWCEGCNAVLLPIGRMCKCGAINTGGEV